VARRAATLSVERIVAGLEQPAGADDHATAAMLDAASSLLADYGLQRWSMDDVAARAGLGRATVYRRFESREDLVHAALARDVRDFFTSVTEAVVGLDTLEDTLVEGFLVGLRQARDLVLTDLLRRDMAAAISLLNTAPVLALARAALVERYEALLGRTLPAAEADEAHLVAEALVRLGLSFILMPDSWIDLDHEDEARVALRRLLGPLLQPD
jgi:AcrR family transcriptional regulator